MNYAEQRAAAFAALLERLAREAGLPSATGAGLASRAASAPLLAALFTGDPTVNPESWDVCVVLPELLARVPGLAGCILNPDESARAATAYGVGKLPALVVLRDGQYLGVIEGMHDWQPFAAALDRLVSAPPRPVPVAGIYPDTRTARPA